MSWRRVGVSKTSCRGGSRLLHKCSSFQNTLKWKPYQSVILLHRVYNWQYKICQGSRRGWGLTLRAGTFKTGTRTVSTVKRLSSLDVGPVRITGTREKRRQDPTSMPARGRTPYSVIPLLSSSVFTNPLGDGVNTNTKDDRSRLSQFISSSNNTPSFRWGKNSVYHDLGTPVCLQSCLGI